MTEERESLLTPEVRALIGQTTEVIEMYDVIDKETARRIIHGIPDQDPRYWDEELAKPKYGGTTVPPLLVSYVAGRKPPWEEDLMDEVMNSDWFDDSGGGMGRIEKTLPSIRSAAPTRTFLHAGDEIEMYRYPKVGDRIFYQSKWVDIQEKIGLRGRFLLSTQETRYWNQDDEVICVIRAIGIDR